MTYYKKFKSLDLAYKFIVAYKRNKIKDKNFQAYNDNKNEYSKYIVIIEEPYINLINLFFKTNEQINNILHTQKYKQYCHKLDII